MSRRRRTLRAGTRGVVVLDSGAVSKLAEGDPAARALFRELTERGWRWLVPAAVLAEVVTGRAEDATVNQVIRAVGEVAEVNEELGRLAGTLRFRARRRPVSGVDALVAAQAASVAPSLVMTGDPTDMRALLADVRRVAVLKV